MGNQYTVTRQVEQVPEFIRSPRKACADVNPDLFHPLKMDSASADLALKVCRGGLTPTCPFITECLEYAIAIGDAWSIMGGTTPEQRRAMVRRGIKVRA